MSNLPVETSALSSAIDVIPLRIDMSGFKFTVKFGIFGLTLTLFEIETSR